jgi:hypothetical protein
MPLAATTALTFSPNMPSAIATTLFGDVQHADTLPPENEALRALIHRQPVNLVPQTAMLAPTIAPLRGGVATLSQPAIEWFMIPRWMSGQWNKRGDMTLSVTNLLSGRQGLSNVWTNNDMTVQWGHQLDKAGNVWQANFIPSERDGTSDGELVRFVTVAQRCESSNPQQLVTRTHYVVTESLGRSAEVTSRFQQESLNDYVPISEREIENKSSNKMFHMDGQPYSVGVLESKFTKVAEFAPRDFERGINLRQSLSDYLHSQNMDNLIPDANPTQPIVQ